MRFLFFIILTSSLAVAEPALKLERCTNALNVCVDTLKDSHTVIDSQTAALTSCQNSTKDLEKSCSPSSPTLQIVSGALLFVIGIVFSQKVLK